MASTLPNSAAIKAVGDYLRKSTAYNFPLDAGVIDRLIYAGVTTAMLSGGSTGATKDHLRDRPLSGLIQLVMKYSGGGSYDTAPLTTARSLLITENAYEYPVDEQTISLVAQFAASVGFSTPSGVRESLKNSPYTTLIYLLYWVGTPNPVSPYTF